MRQVKAQKILKKTVPTDVLSLKKNRELSSDDPAKSDAPRLKMRGLTIFRVGYINRIDMDCIVMMSFLKFLAEGRGTPWLTIRRIG
jgi:hypothetical protein